MKRPQKGIFSTIKEFSSGSGRYFLAAVLGALFGIVFTFLTPQVIRLTVDFAIGDESLDLPGIALRAVDFLGGREFLRRNLLFCALGIVICSLLSGVFNHISRVSLARGTELFIKRLRDTLFSHIQALPFSWHNSTLTGDIIQRCTSDVETIRNFVAKQLIEVSRTVLLLTVAISFMLSMNTRLTLVCLAFIPFIVLYSLFFHGRISRQFLKADEAEGELMVAVQENLTGVRVVRAFGREGYERDRFREKNEAFTGKWVDLGYTLGLFWGVGDFATGAQLLAVVCAGAYLSAAGEVTLGELLAFISYTQTLAWPVRTLGRTLSEFSKAGVSTQRVREILDADAEPEEEMSEAPVHSWDIEFKNVSFSYAGHEVLHDLSFTVPSGTTFGILGATGSGKSTITYLLNRLYELPLDQGHITIGGIDIRNLDRAYLRRNIGLVLQEPFLFSKTVRENIAISALAPDLGHIRDCARAADVDSDIMSFKDGYDTVVGERGVTLSGGQKQRVAIARALIMDCPVMVFDDSMSSVDMQTDARIRRALSENTQGKTVILISHRINTLMGADKIMVVENGRTAQIGTHEQLLSSGGIYSRVYKLQSDAGLIGGEKNGC